MSKSTQDLSKNLVVAEFEPATQPKVERNHGRQPRQSLMDRIISKTYSLGPIPLQTVVEEPMEFIRMEGIQPRSKSSIPGRLHHSRNNVRFGSKKNQQKPTRSKIRKKRGRKRSTMIKFSNLPLDLKKEFTMFLMRNNVRFEKIDQSGYVEAKLKLVSSDKNSVKVMLNKEDIDRLAKKVSELVAN